MFPELEPEVTATEEEPEVTAADENVDISEPEEPVSKLTVLAPVPEVTFTDNNVSTGVEPVATSASAEVAGTGCLEGELLIAGTCVDVSFVQSFSAMLHATASYFKSLLSA